jgi:hypothetical protein
VVNFPKIPWVKFSAYRAEAYRGEQNFINTDSCFDNAGYRQIFSAFPCFEKTALTKNTNERKDKNAESFFVHFFIFDTGHIY